MKCTENLQGEIHNWKNCQYDWYGQIVPYQISGFDEFHSKITLILFPFILGTCMETSNYCDGVFIKGRCGGGENRLCCRKRNFSIIFFSMKDES